MLVNTRMIDPKKYRSLPQAPGVYLMKDRAGRLLYVGKAGDLRRRVSSYFDRPHDVRIETLARSIARIDVERTDTALEALILEADLIKRLAPPWNVREKDDKSFLYIEITKDKFPRVLLARGRDAAHAKRWGPFTSASSAREALRLLRRIFPWSMHDPEKLGIFSRPCFDYEIGLCPGTCIGAIPREEYLKNTARLALFLDGKKARVLGAVQKEMNAASRALDFEKAAKLRRQLFALNHIRDTALISDSAVIVPAPPATGGAGEKAPVQRIEGYDISNISGTAAVGVMVVFEDGHPNKDEYRKFRIKSVFRPNDVGMLTEVFERRFRRHGKNAEESWPLPDLVLVDGGLAQANAAHRAILKAGLRIPVLGIAKGPERKRNDIIGAIPKGLQKATLVRVRDETHRFAIGYHKKLRGRLFTG